MKDERWAALMQELSTRFGKEPNMEALLFLIGINEYRGRTPKIKFSKEEKQDLMHVAVCHLLAMGGYYKLAHYDEEGWPHYVELKPVGAQGLEKQESLLQEYILLYFNK